MEARSSRFLKVPIWKPTLIEIFDELDSSNQNRHNIGLFSVKQVEVTIVSSLYHHIIVIIISILIIILLIVLLLSIVVTLSIVLSLLS